MAPDPGNTEAVAEMSAYDALPASIRRFIACSDAQISAIAVAALLNVARSQDRAKIVRLLDADVSRSD